MKWIFSYLGVIAVLFIGACESNKKLSQDKAEKAITAFASSHSVSPIPGAERYYGTCSFNVQSIAGIESLSQFSDSEATTIVSLKCERGALAFKFVFQKDIDKRWFLTKFEPVGNRSYTMGIENSMIAPNQNLKVLVQ